LPRQRAGNPTDPRALRDCTELGKALIWVIVALIHHY